MVARIVRLGTPRKSGEGIRIGTVRRPPRGVLKSNYSSENWFDVWFPNLAPSLETMKQGHAVVTNAEWSRYKKKYLAEMSTPAAAHSIRLLAALSQTTNFSVGCYCENEARCHRSILRTLLTEAGAKVI